MVNENRPIPLTVTTEEIRTIVDHIQTSFEKTRSGFRCPVHGVQPQITFDANYEEGVFYEALVCCQHLDDLVALRVDRHLIEHPVGRWKFGRSR